MAIRFGSNNSALSAKLAPNVKFEQLSYVTGTTVPVGAYYAQSRPNTFDGVGFVLNSLRRVMYNLGDGKAFIQYFGQLGHYVTHGAMEIYLNEKYSRQAVIDQKLISWPTLTYNQYRAAAYASRGSILLGRHSNIGGNIPGSFEVAFYGDWDGA